MAAIGAAIAVSLPVLAQQHQQTTGPIARYDMRAGTVSGQQMGARPSMRAIFSGGGGANIQHELYLRLGSTLAPDGGEPRAEHFMPPAALLGNSVRLETPREEQGPSQADSFPQGRRPKGRMLIYWGCGEHAAPGQPVIIDFSNLAAGQVPKGLWSSTILRDWGPTIENSRTFGRWPAEDGKFVRPDSSLIGPHRVAGNYSPLMDFVLSKDFMAPLSNSLASLPSGARVLSWNAIPDATGYFATMFGGSVGPDGQMADMVMWSSSQTRQFGGALNDWLSPRQVAELVRASTVLPPASTQCAIPAEVIRDAGQFRTGTLTAYGPEENFAYPPRPRDPHAVWNISWTARIRHRSTTRWMDIPGMAGMGSGPAQPDQHQQQPACKPKHRGLGGIMGGLGGIIGGTDDSEGC